jgi:hypothetical protein
MNKNRFVSILALFACLLPLTSHAQLNLRLGKGFLSTEQDLVYRSLSDVVVILKQEYVLNDIKNNKEYGLGANDYFGRVYTIGVFSAGKIWVSKTFKSPWLADTAFKTYLKNDTLKPKIRSISYRVLNSKQYKPLQYADNDTSSYPVAFYDATHIAQIVNQPKLLDTNGIIILVASDQPIALNDTIGLNVYVYHTKLSFTPGNKNEGVPAKMPARDNVIGGAFFKPVVSVGKIELTFQGIMHKKQSNWYVWALPSVAGNQLKLNEPRQNEENNTKKNKKK